MSAKDSPEAAAEKIRGLRRKLGWSVAEAARRTEIPAITLRRLEKSGQGRRYSEYLEKLQREGSVRLSAAEEYEAPGGRGDPIADLVRGSTGREPSAIVMELITNARSQPPEVRAKILEAFAIGISLLVQQRSGD